MTYTSVYRRIPLYLADLRENFAQIFQHNETSLSNEQIYAISLACCYVLKNEQLLNNFKFEAKVYLDDKVLENIRAATIMMARNIIFYRFTKDCDDKILRDSEIELTEKAISKPNIDKQLLELCMLAVSIIHDCKYCINYYTNKLLKRDVERAIILDAARLTSVLYAVANALEVESIRSYEFVPRGENI